MEDKLLVAKTLLLCYPHLDDLYEALTKRAEDCIRSGFYAIFPMEQMRIYGRISEYENRKIGLYNMKYMIEQSFRAGEVSSLSLLKEKYIYKKSMLELMKKYGVSLRTCYRQIKKGIAAFCEQLEKLGFDKRRLIMEYGDEPLFQTMLTRVIREDDAENREEEDRSLQLNNRHIPLHRNSDRACCP